MSVFSEFIKITRLWCRALGDRADSQCLSLLIQLPPEMSYPSSWLLSRILSHCWNTSKHVHFTSVSGHRNYNAIWGPICLNYLNHYFWSSRTVSSGFFSCDRPQDSPCFLSHKSNWKLAYPNIMDYEISLWNQFRSTEIEEALALLFWASLFHFWRVKADKHSNLHMYRHS